MAKWLPKLKSFAVNFTNWNHLMGSIMMNTPMQTLLKSKPISKHSNLFSEDEFEKLWEMDDFMDDNIQQEDKIVEINDSEYMCLEKFIVTDTELTMSYFENVYIDLLHIWNPNKLKVLHLTWGDHINFSKFSVTISLFFAAFDKLKYLEDVKLSRFDLDENSLIDIYIDIIRSRDKLKRLDLSK